MKDYHQMKIVELKKFARFNGLKAAYKYKKQELLDWLDDRADQLVYPSDDDLKKKDKAGATKKSKTSGQASPADKNQPAGSKSKQGKPDDSPKKDQEKHEDKGTNGHRQVNKGKKQRPNDKNKKDKDDELESTTGILEVMPDGYGFLRAEDEKGRDQDYYMPANHIKRFSLRSGDIVEGLIGDNKDENKFAPIIFLNTVNGTSPKSFRRRTDFEDLTPIYANQRLRLERGQKDISNRVIDLVAPIGRGQRGLIVSPPKAGKTTLLKSIAHSIEEKYPDIYLFILLIDERPEEVTDFERSVNRVRKADEGKKTEVIASTFDRPAQNHTKTAELLLDRAKRLVESGQDAVILLDSLTRLSRAYNITTTPSGRTLSGGLDPVALYPPKKFFGSARNIDGQGSLTILATCLTDTGSRMDDMIYEEFKGTGNMEIHLSRELSEMRIFPAINVYASGTRRDDLLLTKEENQAMIELRRAGRGKNETDNMQQFIQLIRNTRSNEEFCQLILANVKQSAIKR